MKLFIASFNRASNGALEHLKKRLEEENMLASRTDTATHVLAVGDREETFDCVLWAFKKGYPIIHLWAGEQACWETNDDVYRHSMTLMSDMQLCTNQTAKKLVDALCELTGKQPNSHVVGNVMLDDLTPDESQVPEHEYNLVLYNPLIDRKTTQQEVDALYRWLIEEDKPYIWLSTNGDSNCDIVNKYTNTSTLPRPQFLGLLKNCNKFFTNSSCQYYEAPFLMDTVNIISIGKRNKNRASKNATMTITNATENIIKLLREL